MYQCRFLLYATHTYGFIPKITNNSLRLSKSVYTVQCICINPAPDNLCRSKESMLSKWTQSPSFTELFSRLHLSVLPGSTAPFFPIPSIAKISSYILPDLFVFLPFYGISHCFTTVTLHCSSPTEESFKCRSR